MLWFHVPCEREGNNPPTYLTRQLEESESLVNQLTKAKQNLQKQLEETKASLEDEIRTRAKVQGEARNMQT